MQSVRNAWPIVVLAGATLLVFGRLVVHPSRLIVNAQRISLDDQSNYRPLGPNNDLTRQFLPTWGFVRRTLQTTGAIPLWNPSLFGGTPFIGNPQISLFYPPNVLLIWPGGPAALSWSMAVHLFFGGCGLYMLARFYGLGRLSSLVAGVCFLGSPILLGHVYEGHHPQVCAVAWYPWAWLGSEYLRRGQWQGWVWLPGCLAMMFLAGHVQEFYYFCVVLGLVGLGDACHHGLAGRSRAALQQLGRWAAALALTVGLAGIQLFPDLLAHAWSQRAVGLALEEAGGYGSGLINLLQLLNPLALGPPWAFLGHANYWETLIAIGLLPLMLVLLAIDDRTRPGPVGRMLALMAFTLVFAFGKKYGVYAALYYTVPGMSWFRAPGRMLFVFTMAAALVAGFGFQALLDRGRDPAGFARRVRLCNGVFGGAVLVVLIGFAVLSRFDRRHLHAHAGLNTVTGAPTMESTNAGRWSESFGRLLGSPVFWTMLGGGLVVVNAARRVSPRRRLGRVLAWGLAGLVVAELGVDGILLLRTSPAGRFTGPDPISAVLTRDHSRFRVRANDELYPDVRASIHGIEKTNGYDAFQLQHVADLYEKLYAVAQIQPPPAWLIPPPDPVMVQLQEAVLCLMNVKYIVADKVLHRPGWTLAAHGKWKKSYYYIYKTDDLLPRAYVVPHIKRAIDGLPSYEAVATADPWDQVVLQADFLPEGPRQPFTPAAIIRHDPNRVVVAVTIANPGYLVIGDTWMPGWRATDNGQPASLLRANHAFRCVPLRSGRHRVVLSFWPPGFTPGIGATVATAAALLGFALLQLRRGRARRAGAGVGNRECTVPHSLA